MKTFDLPQEGGFGLLAMGTALPTRRSVEDLAREAGHDESMIARLLGGGLREVPTAPPGTLAELAALAAEVVVDRIGPHRIGAFVLAHSMPSVAPVDAPFLEDIAQRGKFPPVPSITVSGQPCAILHAALKLAGAWSRTLPADQCVLLVGTDRAYTPGQRIFFGSVMGDAAVALAVSRNAEEHRVLASFHHTKVLATYGELSPPEKIAAFREQNPMLIRSALVSCLAQAGCTLDDVQLIVPHTPYLSIWDAVARLAHFPRDRILTDYIGETGHLNSNDSFVHYEHAVRENRIKSGQLALLVNPGFGGTRGCTLIRR